MTVKIQLKRGLKANVSGLTLSAGEMVFATDTKEIYVSDGSNKTLVGRALVDTFANRPTAGTVGRIFFASDTSAAYIDTGSVWVALGGTGGGMTWAVITGNTSATNNNGYLIDATSGAVTLTLPSTPSVGNQVGVRVLNLTNTVTIARNGSNIEGVAQDLTIDIPRSGFTMVYANSTNGWVIVTEVGHTQGDLRNQIESQLWLFS